jgi:hypothetical protein
MKIGLLLLAALLASSQLSLADSQSSDSAALVPETKTSPESPLSEYRVPLRSLGRMAFQVPGINPSGLLGEPVCFSIRSYQVARDDPQSDSTHPVGYSTC